MKTQNTTRPIVSLSWPSVAPLFSWWFVRLVSFFFFPCPRPRLLRWFFLDCRRVCPLSFFVLCSLLPLSSCCCVGPLFFGVVSCTVLRRFVLWLVSSLSFTLFICVGLVLVCRRCRRLLGLVSQIFSVCACGGFGVSFGGRSFLSVFSQANVSLTSHLFCAFLMLSVLFCVLCSWAFLPLRTLFLLDALADAPRLLRCR